MTGRLITFEGRDNSGKSAQVRRLSEALAWEGLEVKTYSFPSEKLRKRLIVENLSLEEKQEAFINDQLNYSAAIERDIRDGKIVLVDRYDLSTIAYYMAHKIKQKLNDSTIDFDHIYNLQEKLLRPDFTFILTCRDGHNRNYMDETDKDLELQGYVADSYAEIAYRLLTDVCDRKVAVVSTDQPIAISSNKIQQMAKDLIESGEPKCYFQKK